MVLFLQRHSIVQLVLHLDLFVRARTIHVYGQERRFSAFDGIGLSGRLGEKALSLLGMRKKVKPIDPELFAPELWKANYDSIEIARRCAETFEAQGCYGFLASYLGGDSNLVRYFEARFALYVARALHMVRLVEALARLHTTYALLGPEQFTDLPNAPRCFERLGPLRTRRSRAHAALLRRIYVACYRLQWLALPLIRLLAMLPRLRRTGGRVLDYKLMMQVVWGAPVEGAEDAAAAKTPKHDFYLYSGRIRPGEILHYDDGSWSFDDAFRARTDAYMLDRSYASARRRDVTMSLSHGWRLLRLQGQLLLHAGRHGLLWRDSASVQNVAARALWEALVRELDLEHFRWSVVFDRTDYNPRHIVDTIVLNRVGAKTVGLHHCASPYDSPQIAFVHYDHYIAIGELFERPYREWWRPGMAVRIGRNHLDWVTRPGRDGRVVESLETRFRASHGTRRHRVVLVLPGDVYYLFPSRWRELESGLRRFVESDLDVAVVVRFKTAEGIRDSPNLQRVWRLCQTDSRLVVEQSAFSLYELMAISHMVITPNCSSAINEAVALDVPVFTFDFHGRTPLVFREYGADFVISTGAELFNRLQSLSHGLGADSEWQERLKREANYTSDSRNHERTRDFVAAVAVGDSATVAATIDPGVN